MKEMWVIERAKVGILYQNDDFGKSYLTGLKEGFDSRVTKIIEATYEATDPTVASQIVSLQAAGVDVLLTAAIPKVSAQAIRKV
jgi:branched-chain amino acid transport system substrate-binding protein